MKLLQVKIPVESFKQTPTEHRQQAPVLTTMGGLPLLQNDARAAGYVYFIA
jgi:hypothetical protein